MIADLQEQGFPASVACQVLGISRAGYYKARDRSVSQREIGDLELLPIVESIFWEHRRRYGARRIAKELSARGHHCGPVRAARLMKRRRLVAIQPRSFRPKTTDSRHALGYSENLLLDRESPGAINQIWVGDITYIPLFSGKFAYCFGTIKRELEMSAYDNVMAAQCEIDKYLVYYNAHRRHSALEYMTPVYFETQASSSAKASNGRSPPAR